MRSNLKIVGLFFTVISGFFCHSAVADAGILMAKENGLLENLQVILLLFSACVFLIPVAKAKLSARFVLLCGVMLSFSFVLRELDVEDLPVPQWMIAIGSGNGRDILLGTGWIAVGFVGFKSFSDLKSNMKTLVLSPATLMAILSAALLLFGSVFDHKDDKTSQDQLSEEILEVVGYAFFLMSALFFAGHGRNTFKKSNTTTKR